MPEPPLFEGGADLELCAYVAAACFAALVLMGLVIGLLLLLGVVR